MINHLDWQEDVKKELTDLNEKLKQFRDLIVPARNKVISHLDVNVIVKGERLGGFTESDADEFFKNLQDFVL